MKSKQENFPFFGSKYPVEEQVYSNAMEAPFLIKSKRIKAQESEQLNQPWYKKPSFYHLNQLFSQGFISECLNLSATNIWDQTTLCCWGLSYALYNVLQHFYNICAYWMVAHSTIPPASSSCDNQHVSKHCQMPPEGHISFD